jgi:hypothetical protein
MTQRQLNRLVSRATGESRRRIDQLGFSVADPFYVQHDPEPYATLEAERYLDWDAVQADRQLPVA